jgi:predicted DNA-binding transcriptional regulator AlpA
VQDYEELLKNLLAATTVKVEFVTVPELARRVHMSPEHLYRLARIGQLPGCVKLGHRYTVNWDEFLAASKPVEAADGKTVGRVGR